MATTDKAGEPHTIPPSRIPVKIEDQHQYHFHFPPVTLHGLAQKMKVKPHWYRKHAHLDLSPCCPETDIRETNLAYHIEIAMAGVKDKESLIIQWMSPRTLIVQGTIARPPVGHGKPAEGEREWEGDTDGWPTEARNPPTDEPEQDGGKLERVESNDPDVQVHDIPIFILNERKIGPFQRTFTLPVDADMKALKAKLEDGLLRIDLPKRDMSGEPKVKFQVE